MAESVYSGMDPERNELPSMLRYPLVNFSKPFTTLLRKQGQAEL